MVEIKCDKCGCARPSPTVVEGGHHYHAGCYLDVFEQRHAGKGEQKWTRKRAREALCAVLGDHRALAVSCYKRPSGFYYYASVWEYPVGPVYYERPPVHLGWGAAGTRSDAIRKAMEDALDRLRSAESSNAEWLAESWLLGNREFVLNELRRFPGTLAAVVATTIATRLDDAHRPGFLAALKKAGEAMAPRPEGIRIRKRDEPLVVEDHCPECGEFESECICDEG